MQFSDTSTKTGIVELLERLTGTSSATTSSYPLAIKTVDINSAYSRYFSLASEYSKTFLADDTNQTDYPIVLTDLVANRQDYSFTVDGSSTPNQIQNVYRVEIKDENGNWTLLTPIDMSDINVALPEYRKDAGAPEEYDKTANGLFLYPKPNYSQADSLRIYVSRTPVYFLSSDTTKTPGIPNEFHEYLAIRPAYLYCSYKALPQAITLREEMRDIERRIKERANRGRDNKPRFIPEPIQFR